ncbi:unnamed protein product [Cunninghamella blakesleeana]
MDAYSKGNNVLEAHKKIETMGDENVVIGFIHDIRKIVNQFTSESNKIPIVRLLVFESIF